MHSPSHAMRNDYDNSVPSHRRCSRRRSRANRQRSDGCRRPRKNLDRGDRRHAGCLHGRAQHPDRQRFAGRHSRRDRRRHRRRWLDLDLLSNRRDCRDPAERLACPGVLDPHLPPDQRLPLHGVLGGLRAGAKPAADDRAARRAGFFRRRADPDGLHADHHAAAEGEAADWPCDVCDLRNLCTRDLSFHWWLYHRELGLGIYFLRESGAGRADDRHVVVLAGSRTDEAVAAARGRLVRHRHHGHWSQRTPDRTGRRQQGRLVPRLMHRFDARIIIGIGFALFVGSNFMNIHMTNDYATDQLFWPNVIRALGQALVFAPLSAVATAGIEAENAGSASGLFNMMRNLGGAVGIALLQTLLTKREQYHSNVLMQSVSMLEQATQARVEKLTQYFISHGVIDHIDAARRAYVAIGKIVQKQAFILAFSDLFLLLGAALIVALAASMMLKKPGQLDAGGAH